MLLAFDLALLAYSVWDWRTAQPHDPWYRNRWFHGVFVVLFAALVVRDVIKLF